MGLSCYGMWAWLPWDLWDLMDFPGGTAVENLPASAVDAGEAGSIPGSGRFPGGRNGNTLLYSYLENAMDRGAWQATGHGVTESDTTECICVPIVTSNGLNVIGIQYVC